MYLLEGLGSPKIHSEWCYTRAKPYCAVGKLELDVL